MYVNVTRKTILITAGVAVIIAAVFLSIGRESTAPRPGPPAVATPAPASPPAVATQPAPPAAEPAIAMPDLVGRNAQVAYEELTKLGFGNVRLASADEADKVVLYPPNWTVVEQTPRAGEQIALTATIVLKCSKR